MKDMHRLYITTYTQKNVDIAKYLQNTSDISQNKLIYN